ncbi:hypothetical protein BN59_02528 [Legionella massiliensis]|uniref:Uncharacterized protein n=1 Tax=Legionella massiliensis TaxID=1034943 RepID=A0A078KUU0_9GAMM|nr:hypothetical protein [Legionella massiliensis]CDZ78220.1 hypothetical protein BN59_02528 [Legionella massiliensis]CEE13958.1 hypothetical protein BN1094_02528 [Legionella massiliensis]
MELQDELTELFKKYPFIHFDQLGELSILVPLTGAQRIAEHFSKGIALYLFGDNTCQSDLEIETFFLGKLSSDGQMDNSDSFPVLFKKLIRELRELKSQQQAVTAKDFLQAIIDRLYELKKETDWFKNNRLGYQNFVEDLRKGNNIFVAKGEFIVRAAPDNARNLDLPNLLVLENKDLNNIEQHMISESSGEDCLAALAKIPVLPHEDGLNLEISEAIGSLIAPLMTYLAKDNRNLRGMFAAIYQAMQKRDDSLQDQSDAVFATIASNFQIQNDDNGSEDYGKWTASELEESIITVFKQAGLRKSQSLSH